MVRLEYSISIGNQVWGQLFLFAKKMPTKPGLEQICKFELALTEQKLKTLFHFLPLL